ncbi:type I restriction endonuclease subunit R [Klebsiella michiganensis]|uniref:type I restriction endonuclease subunit R n=1 Tax=Klebsiella michiganensis TaxID=1134687 RepID=UPI00229CF978|nr:type I restriction endonuclease subunit R [Klebsiella michiganensis]ELC0837566.1 type I restriction endonuclease subunit R [Klebsiella michiganensis]ELF4772229.1 type I restriction endonuclease subunit R [Klebsiella michiganensis]ELS4548720.1 type I restriction endonuclease subunit R [Klebsiella michiganensis]MDS7761127.1 type I restriction endonuclease subunit R [Klebsiella michiganensis]HBM2975396.1 type I restriction endonuclease subunit R [Klebsiella michiganensis]
MVSQTNEQALESTIEKCLVGISTEELKEGLRPQFFGARYVIGASSDFNMQYAIDERFFWQFLEKTQKAELAKLQKNNPADWKRKLLERFDRLIKKHGILHLLKKGLSVDDAYFILLYPAPLSSSSEKVKQNFAGNVFSCTRQVRYSVANPLQEIDMVLFINGIPLITLELKNAWTGQTARYHGQKQYRDDRDATQPLLTFGRCLVHMAVDTDEVYMTTKLAGSRTFFLPFNKGNNLGQGNPPNPAGHKTAYLWQEIFTKESLANIIQHFVRLDGTSKEPLLKRTLFFPRYHQLDVVRKLVDHAATYGVGQTYLIQHSAGSGKSNSITWAAYQLIETYPATEAVAGGKILEQPLFDSVIVVTDRRLLDKQLRDNIKEFSEVKNIIAPANKSSELKQALENGKKIIITTIQKFPFIIDGIADLSDKRFAVIIDEAHSSQSGSAHDNMNRAMGKAEVEEAEDAQDKILQAMKSRKMRGNASYLAFTATPKNSTLEKFGERQEDGSFKPFHLYSMKQAIEEGFILDVLANYTTYKSYYEIEKSIADNPEFDTKKAQKKLRAYVERSQQTIDTKAEIMLEHFVPHVVNAKKLKGKGKGMVVTQNIETAIRYYKAIKRILEEQSNPFKVLIAFSGTKEVDGIEYTEADINGFAETDTKDMFDTDEYRLLVVANKYLTGFDQPKLCAMYVDKKLASVLCVQALSRLNRSAPKLGKKTEDLFVLDFFNSVEDIQSAFDPFYTATSLSQATDINVLHELKDEMDDVGVYEWHEVEDFVTRYFNNEDAQTLSPIIDVAAARFDCELELEPEAKVDFKIKAKQFVKIYGQMASIMPYEMVVWEKLFWFLKFLIPKLKVEDPDADAIDELLDSVDLSSYGLQRVKLNHTIKLSDEEAELDPQNPNPRGAHGGEKETDPLDEIIRTFNERWFQGWSATPEEQKVKFINIAESIRNHPDFESKYKNNPDPHNRNLAFEKMLKEIMLQRRKDELELYKLFAGDSAFKASWTQSMQRMIGE